MSLYCGNLLFVQFCDRTKMNIDQCKRKARNDDEPTKSLLAIDDKKRFKSTRSVFIHVSTGVVENRDIIQYNVETSDIIWSGAVSSDSSSPINLDPISTKRGFMVFSKGRALSPPAKPVFWRARFFSAVSLFFLPSSFSPPRLFGLCSTSFLADPQTPETGTRATAGGLDLLISRRVFIPVFPPFVASEKPSHYYVTSLSFVLFESLSRNTRRLAISPPASLLSQKLFRRENDLIYKTLDFLSDTILPRSPCISPPTSDYTSESCERNGGNF